MKILDLFPVVYSSGFSDAIKDRLELGHLLSQQTGGHVQLSVETLDFGPLSLEGEFDQILAAPFIIEKARLAELNGYSAVVIDCFGDPGLSGARELLKIPVVGANQASVCLAAQLGNRFSIINTTPQTQGIIWNLAARYGVLERLASVKNLNIAVLEIEKDPIRTVKVATKCIASAVEKDGVDTIIFGCTGMSSIIHKIHAALLDMSIIVSLIEPTRTAVYTAISMGLQGVSHSKSAFMSPRRKVRILPKDLQYLTSTNTAKEKEMERILKR